MIFDNARSLDEMAAVESLFGHRDSRVSTREVMPGFKLLTRL